MCRRRAKNLQTAREHLQAGNTNAAYDHYQKAVNISPQVAQQLIQASTGRAVCSWQMGPGC